MEKKGLSYSERDALTYLGGIFIVIVLLGAVGFFGWFAWEAGKKLLEGK